MSRLARIKDVFLPEREPDAALFCTYGFDARFFEAEVLPAMFPLSLTVDRESGSEKAYLHAADVLLARKQVNIFYDHLAEEGPELDYSPRRVDTGNRAFHPKLIVLDYGDLVRVVVGSANLTRPAWTHLLELFRVEDLIPGEPHPWAAGLTRFVDGLSSVIPPEQGNEPLVPSLSEVPPADGDSKLMSTWDGSLLDALLDGLECVKRVDAVSPFFEGSDGPGVFDRLAKRIGAVRGRLFTSTVDDVGRPPLVSGPPDKLRELITTGGWTLHSVKKEWEGDEDGAPLRGLHGKLLGIVHATGARVMMGSANLTRAALLGSAPNGANVELVVIEECTTNDLTQALPQATALASEDVDIEALGDPVEEDDEGKAGAERFVLAATYEAAKRFLTIVLTDDAPKLSLGYDGRALSFNRSAKNLTAEFDLALPRFVTLDEDKGAGPGIVPFVIADPEVLAPRGSATAIGLEEFCEMLAGSREAAGGEEGRARGGPDPDGAGDPLVGGRGAIPWRRYLAAVNGIGRRLELELHSPRGLKFTIQNPSCLAGLLERLEQAHGGDEKRFTRADLAYALYEMEREVRRVEELDGDAESLAMLAQAAGGLSKRRAELSSDSDPGVRQQLEILTEMDAP